MFALTSAIMKSTIQKIGSMNNNATLRFTPEGMTCNVVDGAHIAMVRLLIDKDVFSEFDEEYKETLSVDVTKVEEVVNLSKNDEIISFGINKKGQFEISFGSLSRTMALQPEQTEPKIPALGYKTKIVLNKHRLTFAVKNTALITDHMIIEAEDTGVTISAVGDIDRMRYSIPKELLLRYEFEDKKKSLYNLEYMKSIVSVLDDEIELSFNTDFPMVFNSNEGGVHTTFLLAPRIETD